MIAGTSNYTSGYLRFAPPPVVRTTSTPADAQSGATAGETNGQRFKVSGLRPIQGVHFVSAADVPGLRKRMEKNGLTIDTTPQSASNDVFQAAYADVKVDGKVVATLLNSGTAVMTNEAAESIGNLADPPGLAGPDLAQWRADSYARLLGGIVEKATTAISQSPSTPPQASYAASQTQAGGSADFSA